MIRTPHRILERGGHQQDQEAVRSQKALHWIHSPKAANQWLQTDDNTANKQDKT